MACLGSPISTIVAWPVNARSSTCHCTGSVSWNSSTSTICQRCAHPGAGRRRRASLERVGELAEQVVVGEDPEPPLAALDLGAHRLGEARPGGRPVWCGRSAAGSSRACGSPTAARAIASASAWREGRAAVVERRTRGGRGRRRPRSSRSSRSSTSRARASVSPATPSEPSTSEQNWWVVAMVARVEAGQRLDDPAVAEPPRSSSSQSSSRLRARSPASSSARPPASARSASTSWARTRSRSSWLAARPKVTTSIWSRVATPSAT